MVAIYPQSYCWNKFIQGILKIIFSYLEKLSKKEIFINLKTIKLFAVYYGYANEPE